MLDEVVIGADIDAVTEGNSHGGGPANPIALNHAIQNGVHGQGQNGPEKPSDLLAQAKGGELAADAMLSIAGSELAVGSLRSGLWLLGPARGIAGGCFTADTGILTRDGPREISEIEVGEDVWSFDGEQQRWRWMRVTQTFVHDHEGLILTVHIAGTEIHVTGNHPICVADGSGLSRRARPQDIGDDLLECGGSGRWVEADDLMIGDEVVAADGPSIVGSIVSVGSSLPVYNIQVDGTHTYSVGSVGLLVHNKPAWASYANQLAARYADEAATAASVGVAPVRAGGPGFANVVNQGTIKFVVTESGELIVAPHTVRGVEIPMRCSLEVVQF